MPQMNQTVVVMYRDVPVCEINRKTGAIHLYKPELLPFGLSLSEEETIDERVNNISVFDYWCAKRVLTLDRKHAKEILNYYGLKQSKVDKDKADVAVATNGLSLQDSYWLKTEESAQLQWKDINLFDNSLSNALVDLALSGTPTLTNEELITPDLSTGGVFPKAWERKEKGFILHKGDIDDSVRKEVEASQMLDEMGFPVLRYEYGRRGEEVTSMCQCITTKERGLVPAEFAALYADNYESSFDSYKDKWRYDYDAMNLADYLIGNTDRHMENWGYFFETPNRAIVSMYPLMDFNHAFEGNEQTMCLPERLCGRKRLQADVAYEVYCKYIDTGVWHFDIDFSKYHYGPFVEQRLKGLQLRYKQDLLQSQQQKI